MFLSVTVTEYVPAFNPDMLLFLINGKLYVYGSVPPETSKVIDPSLSAHVSFVVTPVRLRT